MSKIVIIIGTFDTKGAAYSFLQQQIQARGVNTILIDASISENNSNIKFTEIDMDATSFYKNAGYDIEILRKRSRPEGVEAACKAAAKIVLQLHAEKKVDGIIALGGSAGTTIGTAAMRVLPLGFPKVMVSTLASGDTKSYIQMSDITMMYSVVDISGLNYFLQQILLNAANAIVGMVAYDTKLVYKKNLSIALTCFGVTTTCVSRVQEMLTEKEFECVVFHATGTGGMTMEKMIEDNYFDAVCDITTTEWADELVGGILTAGPTRLEAAIKKGIPQVLSVGALDMVNFGPRNTVPEKFKHRKLYSHNENVTLMRTNPEESEQLGKIIAEKLNHTKCPIKLLFPLKGISEYDKNNGVFEDQEARFKLLTALENNLKSARVELIKLDFHINDFEFAQNVANSLLDLLKNPKKSQTNIAYMQSQNFWSDSENLGTSTIGTNNSIVNSSDSKTEIQLS